MPTRDPSKHQSPGDSFGSDDVEILLTKHLPLLRAFVRLNSGPALRAQEESSDLVQTVCRQIIHDAPRLEFAEEAAFRGWLYQAALMKLRERNRYYSREKRDPRRATSLDDELSRCYASMTSPSQAVVRAEERERLEQAFDELSDDHRRAVTLAKLAGLSHRQIAVEMERTEGAVRVLLHRAMARLATILER